jgi:phytanoyl-CoA hydroxylase
LTREEREFYEVNLIFEIIFFKKKNGYIVVKKMFSDDDISRWVERFKEYADGKLEKKYGM